MPRYYYEATDPAGALVRDHIDAPDQEAAETRIRRKGFMLQAIWEDDEPEYNMRLPEAPSTEEELSRAALKWALIMAAFVVMGLIGLIIASSFK